MTHVAGHVGRPEQSFGILLPVKIGDEKWDAVPFPILFTGCEENSQPFKLDDKVAFHPYIIPWCKNKNQQTVSYLVIAGDVVPFTDHKFAESELMGLLLEMDHPNKNKKIEDWGMSEDEITQLEILVGADTYPRKYRNVLLTSCKYMRSESFRILYKKEVKVNSGKKIVVMDNDAIVDWIIGNGKSGKGVPLHITGIDSLKGTDINKNLGNDLVKLINSNKSASPIKPKP